MLAVDTIVIVRLITADDPVQFRQARALFDQHEILLLKTVLLESDWVLRSVYRYDRRRVIDAFAKLVALPRVECDELATVTGAIEWRRAGWTSPTPCTWRQLVARKSRDL